MENIKIIVDNVIEDETGAGGLWDLAREMAIQALGYPDGDEDLNNAINETQERFYNTLLDYATYTDPDHYSNRKLVQNYSYSMKESVDENNEPCNIMTIYIRLKDGNEFSMADITMGTDVDEGYIEEICEETIKNYGYKFVEPEVKI